MLQEEMLVGPEQNVQNGEQIYATVSDPSEDKSETAER
jgi:hypothetical protein